MVTGNSSSILLYSSLFLHAIVSLFSIAFWIPHQQEDQWVNGGCGQCQIRGPRVSRYAEMIERTSINFDFGHSLNNGVKTIVNV